MTRYGLPRARQPHRRRNKYGVDISDEGREERTYRGRVYDSLDEKRYAERLDIEQEAGEVAWWIAQVPFQLTDDDRYRVDFLVAGVSPDATNVHLYAVDVKGAITDRWRRVAKLWAKYGPIPLYVVRKGSTVDVIEGHYDK